MKLSRKALAAYLTDNYSPAAIKQVAGYLVDNGRSKEVELVIREVEAALAARGRSVARVKSARKLEADEQRNIVSMLKRTPSVSSVEIINEVDPALLGGVIVSTSEMEMDLSIRNRLNRMQRSAHV